MRLLSIDADAKAKVKAVVDYSESKEHWYLPKEKAAVPGDIPEHCCLLDSYRCVFSITVDPQDGRLFRHLSISVSNPRAFPNPYAVWTIAELFGMSGWDGKTQAPPKGWYVSIDQDQHCIVVGQEWEKKP